MYVFVEITVECDDLDGVILFSLYSYKFFHHNKDIVLS